MTQTAATFETSVKHARAMYLDGLTDLSSADELRILSGKRVCIVGCTGLIGGTLTDVLLRANQRLSRPARITGIARSRPAASLREIDFMQASITDADLPQRLSLQDYVIYIAGPASDYRSRVQELIDTQLVGLERFLMSGHGRFGFVYISSTHIYGHGPGAFEEDDARLDKSRNIYATTKYCAEALCRWYGRERGARTLIIRPTNIYGAGPSRARSVLDEWITQATRERFLRPRGHPDSLRNHCCVLDLVQGIVKAIAHGESGRAYNIGGHEHSTTRQLACTLAAALPFEVSVEWPEAVADFQRVSIERARNELGYEPKHDFETLAPYLIAEKTRDITRTLAA